VGRGVLKEVSTKEYGIQYIHIKNEFGMLGMSLQLVITSRQRCHIF
jgi:hypothetical protein